MAKTLAALVFHSEVAQATVDVLQREYPTSVLLFWTPPVDVNYVLSNADLIHIASRYHALPQDVPVMVLIIHITAPDERGGRVIESRWNTLLENHEVLGDYDVAALNRFTAPVAVRQHELRNQRRAVFQQRESSSARDVMPSNAEQIILENGIRLSDLFNPTARLRQAESQPRQAASRPVADNSTSNFFRNRNANRQMVMAGQQEAAARRAAAAARQKEEEANKPVWVIDWNLIDVWVCPDPQGKQVSWPIQQMTSQHLWETICWMVTNCVPLIQQYVPHPPKNITLQLAAKQWLRCQPAFRALVQEAVRRRMTFPEVVFQYIREYVVGRTTTAISVSVPWNDPAAAHQTEELAAFLNEPLSVEQPIDPLVEFGREFRDINI